MRRWIILYIVALLLVPILNHARANTIELILPHISELQAGKTIHVQAKLRRVSDGAPVTLADLRTAHTKKLHLLVIDPTLADYHHLHPIAQGKPGEYEFDFTPKFNARYRVFADLLPVATGQQEYVQADIGPAVVASAVMDRSETAVATVDGYQFSLTFDAPLKTGVPAMANITVTRDGKPVTRLEPVMGAFAHVVAFGEDHQSVLHVHPMDEEPKSQSALGGPNLQFHIVPHAHGFIKLFAQVRINGRDIFAPFGAMVQ